jgi:hypothetical protein
MDETTQKVYDIFGKIYQSQNAQQGGQPDQEPQDGPGQNPDGSVDADGEVR